MICVHCKKKIEEPLLLYNGSLSCPSCKRLLTAVDNFYITEENEELYRLSENLFFCALTSSDKNEQKNQREKAVDYCKRAAITGHPYAIVRLGYYYEKGLVGTSSKHESERGWRIAYGFYSSVCFSEPDKQLVVKLKNANPIYQDEGHFEALKKTAARYLLDMLLTTDESFNSIPRFNYNKNREKVLRSLDVHEDRVRMVEQEKNRMEILDNTLSNCLEKKHAPLFGYILLKEGELSKLLDYQVTGKNLFKNLRNKGVEFFYIDSDSAGGIDDIGDNQSLHPLSTKKQIQDQMDVGLDNGCGYLVFFNEKNGRRVLSASAASAIKDMLKKDYGYMFRRFVIETKAPTRVFFEDDIRHYVKKSILGTSKRYAETLEKLLQGIKEE